MSELIRRANSIPGSPFSIPYSTPALGSSKSKLNPLTARSGTAYSNPLEHAIPHRAAALEQTDTSASAEEEEQERAGKVGGGDGGECGWGVGVGGAWG